MMPRAVSRLVVVAGLSAAALLAAPPAAYADLTAFLGSYTTPTQQKVLGASAGFTILVAGLEFEYAFASEDLEEKTPSLQHGSASVLVQTPTGRVVLYGLVGGGFYREQLDGKTLKDGTSVHAGGGVKIGLAGPVGLRLDYRIITLNGHDDDTKYRQRFYAGLRVDF